MEKNADEAWKFQELSHRNRAREGKWLLRANGTEVFTVRVVRCTADEVILEDVLHQRVTIMKRCHFSGAIVEIVTEMWY